MPSIIGAVALIIVCSGFLAPQQGRKKYLTLNLVMTGMTEFSLVTVAEDGKTEEIAFEKATKNAVENEKTKLRLVNEISAKGYDLVFVSGTQWVFEKK